MGPTIIFIGALAAIGLLYIALYLLGWLITGAVRLFAISFDRGAPGLIVYLLCWVFLTPLTVIACIIAGAMFSLAHAEEEEIDIYSV